MNNDDQTSDERSLANIDPEIASLIGEADRTLQHTISLLPYDNAIVPAVADAMQVQLQSDANYHTAIDRVAQILNVEHVELRLDTRRDAALCVVLAAVGNEREAPVWYFNLIDYQPDGAPNEYLSYLRQFLANVWVSNSSPQTTEVISVPEKLKQVGSRLIIVNAAWLPTRLNLVPFRSLADETGALLAVDIGYFAGLVGSGLYSGDLSLADFVFADTSGTLRGPVGGMILSRGTFRKQLSRNVEQFLGEEYDISASRARALAIEESATTEGIVFQSRSIENARSLAKRIEEYGFRSVMGLPDTHLILADFSKLAVRESAVRWLRDVGLITTSGTIGNNTGESPSLVKDMLTLGTGVVTDFGMESKEMNIIGEVIGETITDVSREGLALQRAKVRKLCLRFSHSV